MKLFVQADADKRFPVKGDVKLELPARNTLETCPFHAFPSVSMLKVLRAVCLLCIDVAEEQKRGGDTVFHGRGCCRLKPGVTKIYRLGDLFSMTQNEQRSEVIGPSDFCRTGSMCRPLVAFR